MTLSHLYKGVEDA